MLGCRLLTIFLTFFSTMNGYAKSSSVDPEFEKSVFHRFQSKARRDFYKKEVEALCAKEKCAEEKKQFPSVQLLGDPELSFRFEVPNWAESKGKLHKGQILSAYDLRTSLPDPKKVDVMATLNFVNRLLTKSKEQSGRLFQVRSTPFGEGVSSLSIDDAVMDKDYTINLLLYPPIFEGVQADFKLKKVLVAPVLQNDILVAEDTPTNRKLLKDAIPKLRKLNDERFWASQKIYSFTGKDFADVE